MQLIHDPGDTNSYHIESYTAGKIKISGEFYHNNLIVSKKEVILWQPKVLAELTADDLYPALELHPQVLLLGTGEQLTFPPVSIFRHCIEQKIGYEVMNTLAACHTYTILMAEGRNVVAALFI